MNRSETRRITLPKRLLWMLAAVLLMASACAGDDTADEAEPQHGTPVAQQQAGDDTADEAEPTSDSTPLPTVGAGDDTADEAEPTSDSTPLPTVGVGDDTADEAEPQYQRIVSLSPTGTEILYAIGAGDRVVAVDEYSYYPDGTPVTDLSGWSPNVEAIVSYDPDLVVMRTDGDVIASLDSLGIASLVHDSPATFDDVYMQIAQFGVTLGLVEEADQLISSMRSQIAELVDEAPDASGLTYYHELTDALYSVTSGTFVGHVYSLFGLSNVADAADSGPYPQLSAEYLLDADPDLIFLADTLCCGQNAETLAARPGWDLMTAVRSGNVVELNDDIVSRWGPRLVDFVAAISDALVTVGAAG